MKISLKGTFIVAEAETNEESVELLSRYGAKRKYKPGSSRPNHGIKTTPEQRDEMARKYLNGGVSLSGLAKEYGLTPAGVYSNLKNRGALMSQTHA